MRHRPLIKPAQWLILALILFGIDIGAANATNILDTVGQTYQNATTAWAGTLSAMAKSLFLKLAMIEILWSGIWWVLEADDPNKVVVSMLRKVMGLMFFWTILLNFDTWIPAIINGFTQAGSTAGGTGALTPSTVMDRGLQIATTILNVANNIGLMDGVSGLGKYLIAGLAALAIVLAFGVIAGQMLVTLVESYFCISAGVLFLGFAGSRWTTTFAEKYISYCVSVGVKLFVTYLVIGAGQNISNNWAAMITSNMVVADYLSIMIGALVYMFLAWQIPALASSMLTGAVSMTLGSAMATAGTMVAGTLGAAGAAAAAGSGAVNGVAGAVKAGAAAINQAKSAGATGALGIAAGAAGAMASGVAEAAGDAIKGLGSQSAGGSLANRIDTKTASMAEAAAAGAPAASVPGAPGGGAGGGSPASAAASTDTPPEPSRETPPAPGGGVIDTSTSFQQALAERASGGGGSAPAAPAASPAAAPSASTDAAAPAGPADAGTATGEAASGASPSSGAAASSSGGQTAAPAGTNSQPQAPQEKDGMLQTLAQHAEALGKTPNDSAAGAGVQVNLKHHE